MQLAVSYDNHGRITLMFDPSKLKNDKGTFGYQPAAGENHQLLDVPPGLEGKSLPELASMLQVNTAGAAPILKAKA
ncbi:MAG TPA: hypothetical protein VMI53_00585 [Opitutaceae bacterium]|nr:hypothetical protein [Opitutaceae bacterium]